MEAEEGQMVNALRKSDLRSRPGRKVPPPQGTWLPPQGHCEGSRRAVTWQVEHAWKVSLLWGEKLRSAL